MARSGGGVFIGVGSDYNNFTDTAFSRNTAVSSGGGISMGFAAPATLNRCTLSNNIAQFGGGIINDGINMANSTISKNIATTRSSAIWHIPIYFDN